MVLNVNISSFLAIDHWYLSFVDNREGIGEESQQRCGSVHNGMEGTALDDCLMGSITGFRSGLTLVNSTPQISICNLKDMSDRVC